MPLIQCCQDIIYPNLLLDKKFNSGISKVTSIIPKTHIFDCFYKASIQCSQGIICPSLLLFRKRNVCFSINNHLSDPINYGFNLQVTSSHYSSRLLGKLLIQQSYHWNFSIILNNFSHSWGGRNGINFQNYQFELDCRSVQLPV